MNGPTKKIAVAIALLVGSAAAAFSQSHFGPAEPSHFGGTFSVNVVSNAPNSSIYVDGRFQAQAPNTFAVAPGTHLILVRANGYEDFSESIAVYAPVRIDAHLRRVQEVRHRAPPQQQQGGGHFGPALPDNRTQAYNLSIGSNTPGAQIYLDDRLVGVAPMTLRVPRGSHHLRLSSPGHTDYNGMIQVQGNSSVNAQLQPAWATIVFDLPTQVSHFGGGGSSGIDVYVDGRQVTGTQLRVTAGNHSVRFTNGSLSAEQNITFRGGRQYSLRPVLTIRVN